MHIQSRLAEIEMRLRRNKQLTLVDRIDLADELERIATWLKMAGIENVPVPFKKSE